MQKVYILLLCLFSFSIYSQTITLDDIVYVRDKDIATVEEYLSKRDCKLISVNEPADGNMGEIIFAYKKNQFTDDANAFIIYYYSDITKTKRIVMQVNGNILYNSFLNRIKSLGLKLIDSKVVDGEIIKTYQGKTTTVVVNVAILKDSDGITNNQYFFNFRSNIDHNANFFE